MKADYIFKAGGIIFPANLQGQPISKLDNPDIQITSRERLIYFYNKGIRRFVFRPQSAGLVALDIDCKNGKDGLTEFMKLHFVNFEDQYPYTKSPSGGYHIYFKSPGADFVSCEIASGLEVKYYGLITIPGSISDKGKYTSFNDESYLKPLPDVFCNKIPIHRKDQEIQKPISGNLELNKIMETLNKQGYNPRQGNRNLFSFEFSKFARKNGHQPDTVLNFLAFLESPDFTKREISATVQSAYRGRC